MKGGRRRRHLGDSVDTWEAGMWLSRGKHLKIRQGKNKNEQLMMNSIGESSRTRLKAGKRALKVTPDKQTSQGSGSLTKFPVNLLVQEDEKCKSVAWCNADKSNFFHHRFEVLMLNPSSLCGDFSHNNIEWLWSWQCNSPSNSSFSSRLASRLSRRSCRSISWLMRFCSFASSDKQHSMLDSCERFCAFFIFFYKNRFAERVWNFFSGL